MIPFQLPKSEYDVFPKSKLWYAVQFYLNNPTSSDYTIDLFNGYNQTPIQTYPNPIVPPSGVTSSINGAGFLASSVYNPINNFLYIGDNNGSDVLVINCLNNSTVTTIIGAGIPQVYNPINNSIYCNGGFGGFVYVINCSTNTISNTINIGSPLGQIVYNQTNNRIYIGGQAPNQNITVIDCATNVITSLINISDSSSYLAYNSNSNTVYGSGGVNINVVNCSNDSFSTSFFLTTSDEGIVYNPLNNNMYIAESGGSYNVNVINCSANTLISTISVGVIPIFLSYNPLSNLIYSTAVVDKTISVIDCYSNTVSSVISMPNDCIGSTFVPEINTLYVTNNGSSVLDVLASQVPFVPYITGSTDYNQFLREIQNIPKRVKHITLTVDNLPQLAVPFEILKRDANGNMCNEPKLPTTYLDTSNYQPFICDLPFKSKELILNNTTIFSQYIVKANSVVNMVIFFDEIDMSDLLSEQVSIFKRIEPQCPDANSLTEYQIEAKESRPFVKPSWLKNFKKDL